ncbi:MAG: APC family permease [Flavobacteriaceae bacterium]
MTAGTENARTEAGLLRALGLAHLVFYGVGVTIGAGIFALIGEIHAIAGDAAALSFLLAGAAAGMTARSYALLSRRYPRAAGEAVYAGAAFGPAAGRLVGTGILLTAVISSAAITLAFAGYLTSLAAVPLPVVVVGLLLPLAAIAWAGVRESILAAAAITVLETGVLLLVVGLGFGEYLDAGLWRRVASLPADLGGADLVFAAAAVAFFAFIGFEDIVNMAEETVAPERTVGRAILVTLAISTVVYVLLAVLASALSDRVDISASPAPVAAMFEALTGSSGAPVAVVAMIAMVNGILVQIVMASRVVYGMAGEGLLHRWLAAVHPIRRTPHRAIWLVAACVGALALVAPLLELARTVSCITLGVFTAVNLSLVRIAWRSRSGGVVWGLAAALVTAALLGRELVRILS